MTYSQSVDQFLLQLKRRQLSGSNQTATETANLLRTVISNSRWANAKALIQLIIDITKQLVEAQPVEFSVGNICRRILRLVREEYRGIFVNNSKSLNASSTGVGMHHFGSMESVRSDDLNGSEHSISSRPASIISDSSMYNLLAMSEQPEFDYSKQLFSLKQSIIQSVNELIDELETVESSIAAQASEYIDPGDLVLTVGRSNTVEQFLLQAAVKQVHFSVIVAESSLPHQGRALADALKAAGIDANCIPDASIFSVMSRVNKVIIGCHAVTANGGIIARGGSLLAAVAAKHYSTPVCVVTGMYKVTPIYPENHEDFNLYTSPHSILPYADGLGCRSNIKLVNPLFDHVNASFVNLFVTNVGTHPPTYVYRLLGELYDQEDFDVIKPNFH